MIDTQISISINTLIAFLFGIIIGYTRNRNQRPAGMRTQALICATSAMISGLSIHLGKDLGAPVADPARLMAQLIAGIGFLGGGIILRNGDKLKGVTTASIIWFCSSIGIMIGVGYYIPAIVGLGLIIIIELIAQFEYRTGIKTKPFKLDIKKQDLDQITQILTNNKVRFKEKHVQEDTAALIVYSSNQINDKLAKHMQEQSITYRFERLSSLHEE